MVVVQILMYPRGDESQKRLIGLMTIANDGTGTKETGDYAFAISHTGKYMNRKKEAVWKSGKVVSFSRKKSVYHLIARVLKEAGIK